MNRSVCLRRLHKQINEGFNLELMVSFQKLVFECRRGTATTVQLVLDPQPDYRAKHRGVKHRRDRSLVRERESITGGGGGGGGRKLAERG